MNFLHLSVVVFFKTENLEFTKAFNLIVLFLTSLKCYAYLFFLFLYFTCKIVICISKMLNTTLYKRTVVIFGKIKRM